MFDFEKYYADLFKKKPSAFDNSPGQFRYFGQKKNKERLLELLNEESDRRNGEAVQYLVSIVFDHTTGHEAISEVFYPSKADLNIV